VVISEDYTSMNGVLYWDFNIIIFFLFTVQTCGPRNSADCAHWRKLGSFTTNFYAEMHLTLDTLLHPTYALAER